jgi:hypothetical protein
MVGHSHSVFCHTYPAALVAAVVAQVLLLQPLASAWGLFGMATAAAAGGDGQCRAVVLPVTLRVHTIVSGPAPIFPQCIQPSHISPQLPSTRPTAIAWRTPSTMSKWSITVRSRVFA